MLSVNFVFLQSEPEVEYLADVDFDESDLSDVEVSKPPGGIYVIHIDMHRCNVTMVTYRYIYCVHVLSIV